MVGDSDLACHDDAVTDYTTAGYAYLTGKYTALTDNNIVAYLNQVVELCTGPYNGIVKLGPVNTTICPNFHTILNDNAAVVGNEFMAAVNPDIAESGRADRRIGLNNTVIADSAAMIHDDVGVKAAVRANGSVLADHAARPDTGV